MALERLVVCHAQDFAGTTRHVGFAAGHWHFAVVRGAGNRRLGCGPLSGCRSTHRSGRLGGLGGGCPGLDGRGCAVLQLLGVACFSLGPHRRLIMRPCRFRLLADTARPFRRAAPGQRIQSSSTLNPGDRSRQAPPSAAADSGRCPHAVPPRRAGCSDAPNEEGGFGRLGKSRNELSISAMTHSDMEAFNNADESMWSAGVKMGWRILLMRSNWLGSRHPPSLRVDPRIRGRQPTGGDHSYPSRPPLDLPPTGQVLQWHAWQ